MKTIPLTQGKIAIVDDEDFELVSQYKWHASHGVNDIFYAYANIKKNKKYIHLSMHQLIMKTKPNLEMDHINHNGLDNRKSNLRFVTRSENMQNARSYKNSSSKFKGVCWDKSENKWVAHIWHENKLICLGSFKREIKAALTYDKAAIKYFGKFANPNILSNHCEQETT